MVEVRRVRLFLILSFLLGIFLLINPTSAESNLSGPYKNLFLLVTILSVVVGVGVIAVWILFIVRFRETNTETVRTSISHETARKLEVTWTTLAVLIVILLMVFSYPVLIQVDDDAENLVADEDVYVYAQQFSFLFAYQGGNESTSVTLQVDQVYRFIVTSRDVIHSFFVPELHFKIDAVPGTVNEITIEITKTGTYEIWCNEYCGAGHSAMIHSFIEVTS